MVLAVNKYNMLNASSVSSAENLLSPTKFLALAKIFSKGCCFSNKAVRIGAAWRHGCGLPLAPPHPSWCPARVGLSITNRSRIGEAEGCWTSHRCQVSQRLIANGLFTNELVNLMACIRSFWHLVISELQASSVVTPCSEHTLLRHRPLPQKTNHMSRTLLKMCSMLCARKGLAGQG